MVLHFFKSASSSSSANANNNNNNTTNNTNNNNPAAAAAALPAGATNKPGATTNKANTLSAGDIITNPPSAAASVNSSSSCRPTLNNNANNTTTISNTTGNTSPPLTPTATETIFEPKPAPSPPSNNSPLPPSPLPSNSHSSRNSLSTSEKPPSRLFTSLSSSFLQLALSKTSASTAAAVSSASAKRPKTSTPRVESSPSITATTSTSSTTCVSRNNSPLASSPTFPPAGLSEPSTTATTSVSAVVVTPHKSRLTISSTDSSQPNSATDLLKLAMAQNGLLKLENEDELSGQRTPRPDFQDRRIPAILHGLQQVCVNHIPKISAGLRRGFSSVTHLPQEQGVPSTEPSSSGKVVLLNGRGSQSSASTQPLYISFDVPEATTTQKPKQSSTTIMSSAGTKPADFCNIVQPANPAIQKNEVEALTKALTIAALKDTPPATPRGTTSEGKAHTKAEKITETSNPPDSLVTRPPKGRITVRIIAGRNLRTTLTSPTGPKDPYIVCTFESNESISKGSQKKEDGSGKPIGIPGIRGISIPMRSRTSSSTDLQTLGKKEGGNATASWDHEAIFDVVQEQSEMAIAIYDRDNQETFLGMVRLKPDLKEEGTVINEWFSLQPRSEEERSAVSGEIQVQVIYEKTAKKHYGPTDFQILRLIGRGTFGQVYQVRKKDTNRIYAMKVLSKKVIVQKKEVAHTIGERNILVRTATTDSPFIVGLKFSFQTPTDLYLVTDYMSGGELFWHLQQEGRFSEERAKFYIAELILALEHLHNHDIVYRDLKPENILLDANGHIALCDFGLSKSNLSKNETTNTFCGTTEYLAPEVLLDELGYTKMVDFWSLGVLVFEMCCGWSPFYAEDTQQMYKNIAFGKVRFPKDALSLEGRNFVKGLLNRNPKHRLGAQRDAIELKEHPFFSDVDWEALKQKKSIPPFKPTLKSEIDTSNFDTEFTNAPIPGSVRHDIVASTPLSPGMQNAFRGFTFVDERTLEEQFAKSYQSHHSNEDKMDEDSDYDDDSDEVLSSGDRGGVNIRTGTTVKHGDDEGMFTTDNIDN
ncbi:Phototropin-2 [Dactylellina cionopaga]|nr:Phototropin-2 [Dactylellina cionopaga]